MSVHMYSICISFAIFSCESKLTAAAMTRTSRFPPFSSSEDQKCKEDIKQTMSVLSTHNYVHIIMQSAGEVLKMLMCQYN